MRSLCGIIGIVVVCAVASDHTPWAIVLVVAWTVVFMEVFGRMERD